MGAPALFLLLSLLEAVSYSKRIPFKMQTMGPSCVRCCGTSEKPGSLYSSPSNYRMASDKPTYPWPQVKPNIDITILKGSKGENGEVGLPGRTGKEGLRGSVGSQGAKGSKGKAGPAGHNCKHQYAAFSVGRRKGLHSGETPAQLIFDTVFVNLYDHFDMFTGTFRCRVPGIYSFDLNVHTWNFKETYLHLMRNDRQMVILYAQTSERSIMQSQSVMLELVGGDEVWVQLFRQGRENAIYSDEVDVYITFSGHLIKPADD